MTVNFHQEIGDGQRHEEEVGQLAQLLLVGHGDAHQQVADDGQEDKQGQQDAQDKGLHRHHPLRREGGGE